MADDEARMGALFRITEQSRKHPDLVAEVNKARLDMVAAMMAYDAAEGSAKAMFVADVEHATHKHAEALANLVLGAPVS